MIFLVQFGINQNLVNFSKLQIALVLRARTIWLAFENLLVPIYPKLHSKKSVQCEFDLKSQVWF